MADDHYLFTVETGHAAQNCGIVGVAAIAVNLAPIRKNALDVIERIRALRMPRQFGLIPGAEMRGHLLAQALDTLLKLLNLAACALVLALERLKFIELPLDFFQLLLRLMTGIHLATVTVPGGPASFDHRQKEIRACNY